MNTQKHTDGQWLFTIDNCIISRKDIEHYSEICKMSPRPDREANAKLIAAAPDMLENLTRLIDRIEESNLQDYFPSAYQRAKAAINQATN